jgi:hypothetical protein
MIYEQIYENEIRHIISLVDRNAASSTNGCFDRKYWNWRIGDMPSASLQYGVYALAWLWLNDASGKYRNNINVLEWILSGMNYWAEIQNRNGSFNQFFPYEQSVGTTYYTLSAVLFAFDGVKDNADAHTRTRVQSGIERAAQFLLKHQETYAIISNHLALYAYVNLHLARFTGDDVFRTMAMRQIQTIFHHQSSEGWFLEYEGADPGYQTQCIYYLAECYLLTRDREILERIRKSIESFLVYCFHPDGSFGGEYGSRNTEIIYPAGFEMLGNELPICREIVRFIRSGLSSGSLVSLDSLDDENLIRLATNYMIASQHVSTDEESVGVSPIVLPCDLPEVIKDFPEAGIFVRGNKRYYSIVSASKGGIIKVFDKRHKKLAYEDNGYFLRVGKHVATNQVFDAPNAVVENDFIRVESHFYEVLDGMLTPLTNIVLRILGITLFRNMMIVDMFRRMVVRKAFTGKKRHNVTLVRALSFGDDVIRVEDELTKGSDLMVTGLVAGRKRFALKMASSNYHSDKDLLPAAPLLPDIVALNQNHQIRISNKILLKEAP